jgi:hypothetical protein
VVSLSSSPSNLGTSIFGLCKNILSEPKLDEHFGNRKGEWEFGLLSSLLRAFQFFNFDFMVIRVSAPIFQSMFHGCKSLGKIIHFTKFWEKYINKICNQGCPVCWRSHPPEAFNSFISMFPSLLEISPIESFNYFNSLLKSLVGDVTQIASRPGGFFGILCLPHQELRRISLSSFLKYM